MMDEAMHTYQKLVHIHIYICACTTLNPTTNSEVQVTVCIKTLWWGELSSRDVKNTAVKPILVSKS